MNELVIDSFAGGGGASTGIEAALGRPVDIAINHDPEAIAMHKANHPQTKHYCENVWDVDPREATGGRPVGLMWFSPDCTYHSKARGGKPFRDRRKARRTRGLAWLIIRWAKAVRPRVIIMENVEEFANWGPLLECGKPCPIRRGQTFQRWHRQLENLGYRIDMRELRACDYGAPTIRKRPFIVARCDDGEIIIPEPTHGPGLLPYRTAAECIDWSIPCPSIFTRTRPLAEATMRRIAHGIMRYVINCREPFIVNLTHGARAESISDPLRTVTGANRGEKALIAPHIMTMRNAGKPYNEANAPTHTITAGGAGLSLVSAFLAKHFGGNETPGWPLGGPISTVTAKDHHALVTSHLLQLRNNCYGRDMRDPVGTLTAGGGHFGEVRAFLCAYYGNDRDGQSMFDPMRTVTTKDRLGLVTVHGVDYQIVDIGMRMLQPRELFAAQGFPASYIIDFEFNGKPLTKTAQVRMCGNSVCPPNAEALVRANYGPGSQREACAA